MFTATKRQPLQYTMLNHLLGYNYNSAFHCVECAKQRYGHAIDYALDHQGNEVTAQYCWDAEDDCASCDTCGKLVYYHERGVLIV